MFLPLTLFGQRERISSVYVIESLSAFLGFVVQNSLSSAPGSSAGRALVPKIPQFNGKSIVATKLPNQSVSRNHSVLRKGSALRQIVVAEVDEKKAWDFGKFVQTWQFFSEPFNFGKVSPFWFLDLSAVSNT